MKERSKSWSYWIGIRYLRSKKNSKFLSFITVISVAGIAIGVAAMIIVLSVMEGFEGRLKDRLVSTDLHILIQPTKSVPGFEGGRVPSASLLENGAQDFLHQHSNVLEAWPVFSTEAILRIGRKVNGIALKGVGDSRLERLKPQLVETVDPRFLYEEEGETRIRLPGIFLGQELALGMGIIPGDRVRVISPTELDGPMGAVPRMKTFVVEGVYSSGFSEQEIHVAFTGLKNVESFLRKRDVATDWEITLKNSDITEEITGELKKRLPLFRIKDWKELNATLFFSLKLERFGMFLVLGFIVIVASFNIITTLTLMVLEKKGEISILRAMGAQARDVARIFMAEGLLIGAFGIGIGVTLAYVLCKMLREWEWIQLPEIYYDRTLPVEIDIQHFAFVSLAAAVVVFIACVYPSRRAAKIKVLEGIRHLK